MKHISGKIVTFRMGNPGGPVGHCQVQLFRPSDGTIVMVATELDDNPGPSITNAAENAFKNACDKFEVLPRLVTWIEHYSHGGEDTFDLVRFSFNTGISGIPSNPMWSPLGLMETMRMTEGTDEELTGRKLSPEEYKSIPDPHRQRILDQAIKDAMEANEEDADE